MAQSEGDASLPRQRRGFTVAASPFNAVKLELALFLIVGIVVWLIHDRITSHPLGQLAILGGYGFFAMLWLMVKTRRISRQAMSSQADNNPEQDQ